MTPRLWLLVGVFSAYQATGLLFEEVCYGKNFYFRWYYSFEQKTVLFTPKSPLGTPRLVLDKGKALDPRFSFISSGLNTVRLSEVTMDYEGQYFARGWKTNTTLSLSVKDCSEKCEVDYGESCSWPEKCIEVYDGGCSLPDRRVEQVDYSPALDGSNTKVLWRRDEPQDAKLNLTPKGRLEITRCTPKDQGYYTFRDINGKFLQRYHISMKRVWKQYVQLETGDDFSITFPVDGLRFILNYFPGNRIKNPVILIEDGNPTSEAFVGRMELSSTELTIKEMELDDSGTFEFKDSDGIRAKLVQLEVRSPVSEMLQINYMHLMAGVVIVPVIIMCCCGKRLRRLCTAKNNPTSHPVTQVYVPEASTNGEAQRQPYSMAANQPSYYPSMPPPFAAKPPPYSSVWNESTYNPSTPLPFAARPHEPEASLSTDPPPNTSGGGDGGFLGTSSSYAHPPQGSPTHIQASTAGVDAPTINLPGGFDCLSSGSKFDVPTGPNPSASLLSSDTPSYDVYTSDKLNFR